MNRDTHQLVIKILGFWAFIDLIAIVSLSIMQRAASDALSNSLLVIIGALAGVLTTPRSAYRRTDPVVEVNEEKPNARLDIRNGR